MLRAFDLYMDPSSSQYHACPMDGKPVLYAAVAVEERRKQRQTAHDRGEEIDQRDEETVGTEAAEKAASRFSLLAVRCSLFALLHAGHELCRNTPLFHGIANQEDGAGDDNEVSARRLLQGTRQSGRNNRLGKDFCSGT